MMGDQEDEELKMALRLSMQHDPPEPKRSKPGEDALMSSGGDEEAAELKIRRKQRELMAAAAEKRMISSKDSGKRVGGAMSSVVKDANLENIGVKNANSESVGGKNEKLGEGVGRNANLATELSEREAHQLFSMIFGSGVTMDILVQWSNQGIRFSPDPDTSMGLVQHEGGPCGVLAAIQAFVLKNLLFPPEEIGGVASLGSKKLPRSVSVTTDIFSSLTEDKRSRALVKSMADILFLCGNSKMAVIASVNILGTHIQESGDNEGDEIIAKALDGLSIQSGSDLQKFLRINTYTSLPNALDRLEEMLPLFRCRLGAMLFLISALLSRGLDSIQSDRDDPSQPLVTAPFGHASQEIVNLLLSGMAVANVFDGKIDLGGGMFVNGISSSVEVGFLTLLESLNFCKVGDYLKCPKWPIWVVGSESHYTVLFALDTKVQEENELESRETQIRKAFDAQDQSGGGGFISVEGFHQVLRETDINLPAEKIDHLSNSGFIVWSEFWQSLLDLDKSLGGLKDSSGLLGKKVFDLYHFNGIAKSVTNGSQASSESITVQRPRLTKLRVSVPPRWTPEEYMADVSSASSSKIEASGKDSAEEVSKPEPVQHAPLVDCIRTRWPRAVCNWEGDAPSIV